MTRLELLIHRISFNIMTHALSKDALGENK